MNRNIITLAIALVIGGGLRAAGDDSELPEEQRDIKEIILDLRGRMESLAKKLDPTQPDEARRLKEAAERIRNARLDDLLEEIGRLLASSSFLEAIGRQDRILTEIDALIQLLEKSPFDSQALERKLDAIAEAARETSKLTRAQENLLEKTRQAIEKAYGLEALQALRGEVSKLKEAQAGLNQGQDPMKVDPEGEGLDEKELAEASALLEKLLEAGRKVDRQLADLPPEDLPIRPARELVGRLDELIEKAEEVVSGGEAALESEMPRLADPGGGERGTPKASRNGAASKTEPSKDRGGVGPKAAKGDSKGAEESKGAEGSKDADASEVAEAGKDAGASGDRKESGDAQGAKGSKDAKDAKASSGSDAKAGKEGAVREEDLAGKDPAGKDGSATDSRPEVSRPAGPEEGASALERARAAQAQKERKESLAKDAKALSKDISGLKSEVSKDPVAAPAKDDIDRAAASAGRSAESFSGGDLEKGLESGRETLEDLEKARGELARGLRGMEESNARDATAAIQAEGLLEKETGEGAERLGKSAEKSSSESAKAALEKGSEGLRDAAKAMRGATEALKDGDRTAARQGGGKAQEDLERAKAAIEAGRKDLAGRSAEEKKNDLQKKLGRKAEEARKKAEELEKKLRKKGENESLSSAGKSLSEAGREMSEGADAGRKGDSSLARKKGESAAERLDQAAKDLEAAEREELARLEKENLKDASKEQDELARLTRKVSKKLSEGSKGSDEAENRADEIDQAAQSMDSAKEGLQKEDAESAEKSQKEALAKLKSAREKLREEEERLAKLQREREMLSMVAELSEVKESQEKIHAETAKLHAGREARESRRQKLRVEQAAKKLLADQGGLAERVDGLTLKLKEELARVFTFVLKNVSADMRQIRDSLKELETGTYTQFLQKEVVQDLERLIAALKEELKKAEEEEEKQPMEGSPMEGDQRRRLVPVVAELRMLREMQLDVNRGTRDLEDVRKAAEGNVTEGWEKALNRLMQKQGSVSTMTSEIQKDFERALRGGEEDGEAKPDAPDGGGEVEKKPREKPEEP